jgi:26S proteasome regulatory subunit T5
MKSVLVLITKFFHSDSVNVNIKENDEKIKLNKVLPHLVSNVVEVSSLNSNLKILDLPPEDEDEKDGAAMDADAGRSGKSMVIKTSMR